MVSFLNSPVDQRTPYRYIDGTDGSDSHDGKSWSSAWKTINYALTRISNGDKISYARCGTEQGDIVITKPITLEGAGDSYVDGGVSTLQPATNSSTCLTVKAAGVRLENITIRISSTSFTGIALQVGDLGNIGNLCHQIVVEHLNIWGRDDGSYHAVNGGTGIALYNCELGNWTAINIKNTKRAIDVGYECSQHNWENIHTSLNCQNLVWSYTTAAHYATSWTVKNFKAVYDGKQNDASNIVSYVHGTKHHFQGCDWNEAPSQQIWIVCDDSLFTTFTLSPLAILIWTGNRNKFERFKSQGGGMEIDGNDNTLEDAYWTSAAALNGSGARNHIIRAINMNLNVSGDAWVYDAPQPASITSSGTTPRSVQVSGAGTVPPTTGTWARGDIYWNSAPAAAGSPGWMCVTAGTPGTWKAMAALAA